MKQTAETMTAGVMQLALQGQELLFTAPADDGATLRRSASIAAPGKTLQQGPLNAARVETSIYQVEDLIIPILRELPDCTELKLAGPAFTPLLSLLATHAQTAIPLEAVEYLFNQLADHAGGSAVAWSQATPVDKIALPLLIVRETMHHGGFQSLSF